MIQLGLASSWVVMESQDMCTGTIRANSTEPWFKDLRVETEVGGKESADGGNDESWIWRGRKSET